MQTIEKNEVDISKLFTWGGELTIIDDFDKELSKVHIRLVGDAELNRARVFALRESSKLRKSLHDLDSDERWAYIADIDMVDFEVLVENVLLYLTREITLSVMREIRPPVPKEPDSDATLEEQEKYQAKVDSYPEDRSKLIHEQVQLVIDRKRSELLNSSKELVYKEFERLVINTICEEEMLKRFREMCTYFGSFKDSNYKEKLFKSFEDFDNLPTNIKNQFLEYYSALEINGEDLKKLQEVMQ